jgi:hypothetical protein
MKTEEEILKKNNVIVESYGQFGIKEGTSVQGILFSMREFASQQSVNRRDELIRFAKDLLPFAVIDEKIAEVVDEYLSSHPEPAKRMPNNEESESALNVYAKKAGENFTKPSGIALGWRSCYEWIICQLQLKTEPAKEERQILTPKQILERKEHLIKDGDGRVPINHAIETAIEYHAQFKDSKEVKPSDEDRIRETMNTQHENGDDI